MTAWRTLLTSRAPSLSGRCTAGPCVGDRLTPLPLALEGETLVVRLLPATTSPQ